MPLKINVETNRYAQNYVNTISRAPGNNRVPHEEAQHAQEPVGNERPADGLLTRTLKQIRRASGSAYAAHLSDVVLTKDVNLGLDHSDEVDGGASTRAMDDGWVVVDDASDLCAAKRGKLDDSLDVCAQRAMSELEKMSVDDVRTMCEDIFRGQSENMGVAQKKAILEKLLIPVEEEENPQGEAAAKPQGEAAIATYNKIVAAIKAQLALADELRSIAFNQHDPEARLLQAASRCQRCAEALVDLVVKIGTTKEDDFAKGKIGTTKKDDVARGSKFTEVLDLEMLPKEERAKAMDVEKVVRILDDELADLNQLYADLSAESHTVTADELVQLETGLAKAKKMLADASRNGVVLRENGKTKSGFSNLDKTILGQLEDRVNKLAVEIGRLRTNALGEAMKALDDEIPCELFERLFTGKNLEIYLDAVYEDEQEAKAEASATIRGLMTKFAELKGALAEARKTGDATRALEIIEEMHDPGLINLNQQLKAFCSDPNLSTVSFNPRIALSELKRIAAWVDQFSNFKLNGLPSFINRRTGMAKSVDSQEIVPVESNLLAGVLDGSYGLATVALASAWKTDASLLERGIDGRNLVSSRKLGQGGCNVVTLCTYRTEDGRIERRVFKPEIPARHGWYDNAELPYDHLQQVTMANVVVDKVANKLGIGDRVVRSRPGVHAGQYGLMMELAEGVSGGEIAHASNNGNGKVMLGQKSLEDVKTILESESEDAKTLIGSMCHAFVDLDWLDYITGQTDRTNANYHISVGSDLKVTLKGIDNDLCLVSGLNERQALPPLISDTVYQKLKALMEPVKDMSDEEAWELLAGELGTADMTKGQGAAMIGRMKAAWKHANSKDCARIADEAGWRNMGMIKEKFKTETAQEGLFYQQILHDNAFGLTGGYLAWGLDSDEAKNRFRRLQNVMNNLKFEGELAKRLKAANIPWDEFKGHLDYLSAHSRNAVKAVKWTNKTSDADIREALVASYRKARKQVRKMLDENDLAEKDSAVKSFLPECYRKGIGPGDTGKGAKALVWAMKACNQYWQELKLRQDMTVGNLLLGNNESIDWVAFYVECQNRAPHIKEMDLFSKALVSELESGNVNLNAVPVNRLLGMVINKLSVSPKSVLGPEVQLSTNQYNRFLAACAQTPSGEGYYAAVKAKYEELNNH